MPLPPLSEFDRGVLSERGVAVSSASRNRLRTVGSDLVIPFVDLDGLYDGYALRRPHAPPVRDGKPLKYLAPAGRPSRAYFPAEARDELRGSAGPVYITERPLKALAMAERGFTTVGLLGAWNWKAAGTDDLIDDLAAVPWAGRAVYVVFDYDPKEETRRSVDAALRRLAAALRAAGAAEVYSVDLPPGPGGAKQGVDDFLVAHGPEAFRELVEDARPVGPAGEGNRLIPLISAGYSTGGKQRVTFAPPILGEDAYHGFVGQFLRDVAPYTEATDAGVLAHLLPAVGTLIGPGPYVFAGNRQPARVNANAVGPTSAGRKGTSFAPVDLLMGKTVPAFWAEQRVGGLSTGEGLIAAVADRVTVNEDGEHETVPVEKRLLVVEEEFSRVLAQARRDGNILSQVVREAFDGGNLNVLTRGNPLRAVGAHVSIIGHITPEELAARLSGVDQANGFGNRFLWFVVKSDKVMPRTTPIPDAVFQRFVPRLQAAAGLAPRAVPLAPDAQALWEEVYPGLREDRPGLAGAMSARGTAFVLRVALVYSVLEWGRKPGPVTTDHLRASLAVWEYSRASCYLLFKSVTGTQLGDKIVELLSVHGPMKKSRFTDHVARPAPEIDAALAALAAAGKVRRAKAKPDGPGRPAEVWELTPPG